MKLKEYLQREKIPVTHAAKHLDVHQNHLYFIVNGKRSPGYALAKAIQEYTGGEVTIEELMTPKKTLPKCPHCGRTMWKDRKKS